MVFRRSFSWALLAGALCLLAAGSSIARFRLFSDALPDERGFEPNRGAYNRDHQVPWEKAFPPGTGRFDAVPFPSEEPFPFNVVPGPADVNRAGVSAWQSLGPEGGWVYAMAMHPTNHNVLYCVVSANSSVIFRSDDNGARWNKLGVVNDRIYSIDIDRNNPSTIYASGYCIVYKSTDGGSNWTSHQVVPQLFYIYKIRVHPREGNTVLGAGQYYADSKSVMGVCRSTDAGLNWQTMVVPQTAGLNYSYVYDFEANPKNVQEWYIGGLVDRGGTYTGALYKTTDGGTDWTDIYTGITGYVEAIALDPVDPDTIYAGTYNGIYRSTNAGNAWQKNDGYAYSYGLAVDPQNRNRIYSGCFDHIYKSTDFGIHWQYFSDGLKGQCYDILVDHAESNHIFYAGQMGVQKSTNAGLNWFQSNGGMIASTIPAMGFSPSNPSVLYIEVDDNAVFKSTNSGDAWSRLPDFLSCGNIGALAVHPARPDVAWALEGSG